MNREACLQWVGSAFHVELGETRRIGLRLKEVKDKGSNGTIEQFSLLFEGEEGDVYLQQNSYRIVHEHLGPQIWLIVPIGNENGHYVYEAAFSMMKSVREEQADE
ncbi:hypothetical protein FE783_20610 [Paenibacillus mesophilus]|uniref:DUF6916 family protein n=1 Tax=Paenibacillus mesophilus TaxID=2582849 RepID=UPI00110E33E1|nr:hypothetical protein [Paenibacillus mesophilus]TMV47832.1 hypothetical protein FE783_20610 [Paenibacillus mesophilus]